MGDIKVLIVDDSFVARRGLRNFLESEPGLHVVGEAATGKAAVDAISRTAVDIVLMDIRMPDMDGLQATKCILDLKPDTDILLVTAFEDQPTMVQALLSGARGYIVYGRFSPEDLIRAIHFVIGGDVVMIPPVDRLLIESAQAARSDGDEVTQSEVIEPLTTREREILNLIALGKLNREIAELLDIEEKTVKNHINNIYSKLHIRSRFEAISYILRK